MPQHAIPFEQELAEIAEKQSPRPPYRRHTYTVIQGVEHEPWHPNYLPAIKTALNRLQSQPAKSGRKTPLPDLTLSTDPSATT